MNSKVPLKMKAREVVIEVEQLDEESSSCPICGSLIEIERDKKGNPTRWGICSIQVCRQIVKSQRPIKTKANPGVYRRKSKVRSRRHQIALGLGRYSKDWSNSDNLINLGEM